MALMLRKVAGTNQAQMAEIVGCSVQTIKRLETPDHPVRGSVRSHYLNCIRQAGIDVELDDNQNLIVTIPNGFY